MNTTEQLLDKILKFKSKIVRFEYLPRHRAWIAIHLHGFQSEVIEETVNWFAKQFGTKSFKYANY